jgi:hypothetical protein
MGDGVGVRREIVRDPLARNPFVLTYREAPPEAGGWGATLVTLHWINATESVVLCPASSDNGEFSR